MVTKYVGTFEFNGGRITFLQKIQPEEATEGDRWICHPGDHREIEQGPNLYYGCVRYNKIGRYSLLLANADLYRQKEAFNTIIEEFGIDREHDELATWKEGARWR